MNMKSLYMALMLIALSISVSALECIEIPLIKAFEVSDVVLRGRVTEAQYAMAAPNIATHSIVSIEVQELWKGSTTKEIQLHQRFVGGGIDFHQMVGVEFVIFARRLTPEIRALNYLPPTATSGFMALQCLSKPAREMDLRTLGESRSPIQQ
jgi:hypothetical protein